MVCGIASLFKSRSDERGDLFIVFYNQYSQSLNPYLLLKATQFSQLWTDGV
jgi:hypothetical protein